METWLSHLILFALVPFAVANYEPNWDSLDSRPLPQWYDDAKVGIFLHWGVFSVPSFGSEWFWAYWKGGSSAYVDFMTKNYRPDFTYADFASQFTAEFYDPKEWAEIFKAAGARYIVLTSKHHEGFTNWPSKNSWNWNSMDVGPKRDLLGDLATAVRTNAPDIHFGVYHSLFEWYNPLYLRDKSRGFQSNDFITRKTYPELVDLVNTYKPDVIWSDGDWEAYDWYWNSTIFLAWLFNDSPVKDTVVVNDRWGIGTSCKHGSYYSCQDRYSPGVLQPHKWENAMTLDRASWGYRRNAAALDYLTIQELLSQLASTVSCGGNMLINVGPTHDGRIPPLMEERLRQLGSWLDINGAGIYGSRAWKVQNDTGTHGVWYTANNDKTYAIVLQWPSDNTLLLGSAAPTQQTTVNMLGYSGPLQFAPQSPGMKVTFPDMSKVSSQWAWVLELTGVNPA